MSNKALSWVFENSPYSGTKMVIHLAVADVVNDMHANKFYASNETLAKKAHTTRPTVNAVLKEMVADGYLAVTGQRKMHSKIMVEYEFLFPETGVMNADTTDSDQIGDVRDADTNNTLGVMDADTNPLGGVRNADTNPIVINPSKEETQTIMSTSEKQTPGWQVVWDAYLATLDRCGIQPKRISDSRKQLINRRLKDWSVEELVKAVEGLEFSTFHRGENEQNKRYDAIELILRDAKHIEQFHSYHEHVKSKEEKRRNVNEAWSQPAKSSRIIVEEIDNDFLG